MRRPITIITVTVSAVLVAASVAVATMAQASSDPSSAALAVGRATLPANDGWAASGTGTTGGSTADTAHLVVVHDRNELAAAVAGNTPKIVFVKGGIDANVDDAGNPLTCANYTDPDY